MQRRRWTFALSGCLVLALSWVTPRVVSADDPPPSSRASRPGAKPIAANPSAANPAESTSATAKPTEPLPASADPGDVTRLDAKKDPPGLKRLDPDNPVWLDAKRKRIVMVGEVCLREGQLEMFACLKGTKEHESIVAIATKAYILHAGLLAAGAEAGSPAKYVPTYTPARGTEVEVALFWTDDKGKRQRAYAQDWIRDVKTGKAMQQPWVFGGSGFWVDDRTGEKHYLAEGGDLICVSNFASAMLDLPIQSSATNDQLLFDAFTERIPPMGTKVTVVLTPKKKAKKE